MFVFRVSARVSVSVNVSGRANTRVGVGVCAGDNVGYSC